MGHPVVMALFAGGGEALVDFVPVDGVPPGGEVVGALVLVLEVVGVLPDVVAEDGVEAVESGLSWLAVVTMSSLPSLKTSQPQPEPNCLAVVSLKVFLKVSKSPKSACDLGGDGAGGLAAAAWAS